MRIRFVALLFLASICTSAPASENRMQVGFLVLDKVYNSELMAPYDVFHHTVFHTKPGMRVFTISLNPGPITTFEGLRLQPDYSIANAPTIDILVIPSAEHNMDSDLKNNELRDWVRKKSGAAQFVVNLCFL
jgi:putative intracellular protease/amidase